MAGDSERPYRDCVGIALFNAEGKVFVGRRNDGPEEAWQMPQGGVDAGETPREAAMRELAEEVGTDRAEPIGETDGWIAYDLPEALAAGSWAGRYRGQRLKWFALRFTGSDDDIDIAAHDPEFDAWAWLDLEEAVARIVAFKRPMYRQVANAFKPLADALRDQ